ncbi:MAG: IS1634 family transposase [Candidatus Cloacimonetes bacterium]|nr:IS1634 family transposase [Candidatus Cloacimonadota bacterium]
MFVEKVNNNGTDYLRLVENVAVTRKSGKKGYNKKVILSIGPLSRFDDGKPNYVERLKHSFKNGNPLIDSLKPFVNHEDIHKEEYTIKIKQGDPFCIGHQKIYSHVLIERILEELGLISLVSSYKAQTKIEFDIAGFFRLLIYGRILKPQSKIATARQNDLYYDPVVNVNDFYEFNIYDTLDFVYNYKKQIVNRINTKLIEKQERKTDVIFYDVTNFFFEIERPDDDITDDEDIIIDKGLRKFGVCKENRKLPIVQMGLFMDQFGFPISIEIFPGNTLDHLTVHKALSKNIDNVFSSRYIFIADRGICNFDNVYHLQSQNKGYIMSRSIKKSSKAEKDWILEQDDYTNLNDDFKYKSKVFTNQITLPNGETTTITYKSIVYWSKKFYDREMAENKSLLEFIDKLKDNPGSFRISKSHSKSLKMFLKKGITNIETGEVIDSSKLIASIDMDKINKYKKFFGYYQIITSELDMDDLEGIRRYHRLVEIENLIRIMKSDLVTRPIYVRNKQHIEAHLLICMISLVVIRAIQKKIVDSKVIEKSPKKKTKELLFEMGISCSRIQEALNKWTIEKSPADLFRFNDLDDKDLKIILDAYEIDIPLKLFRRMELKSLKRNIKIFS